MTKRTSSAKWVESKGYWMIKVQQDGMRKSFYSTKPGRSIRCKQAVEEFLELKQEIVGHSKSMDTFDVYGHLVNGQLEDTAKRIDQIFGKFCIIRDRQLLATHFSTQFQILHVIFTI